MERADRLEQLTGGVDRAEVAGEDIDDVVRGLDLFRHVGQGQRHGAPGRNVDPPPPLGRQGSGPWSAHAVVENQAPGTQRSGRTRRRMWRVVASSLPVGSGWWTRTVPRLGEPESFLALIRKCSRDSTSGPETVKLG